MQSRLTVLDEQKGEFDPLEFDRYTRLQELTRLMAESLNDVLSIQRVLGTRTWGIPTRPAYARRASRGKCSRT